MDTDIINVLNSIGDCEPHSVTHFKADGPECGGPHTPADSFKYNGKYWNHTFQTHTTLEMLIKRRTKFYHSETIAETPFTDFYMINIISDKFAEVRIHRHIVVM